MNNVMIAQCLVRAAHRLEREGSSLYRIRAYRRAAETVLMLERPISDIIAENGRKGLRRLVNDFSPSSPDPLRLGASAVK